MRSGEQLVLYLARRVLVLLLLLLVVSFGIFSLTYLAPGDPIEIYLGLQPHLPRTVRILRHEYHLDKPFLTQYWIWLRNAARFRFGDSIQTTLPVADGIRSRLPTSLFLAAYGFCITVVAGVGLGALAAFRKNRWLDRLSGSAAMVALSTPAFVSGVLLIYLFAIVVHVFPAAGAGSGFVDRLWHLTLPAVALSFTATAFLMKHTRAALIDVLEQDYVTFARARGLSRSRVLFAYALRNAVIPIVTIGGVLLSFMITGAVLVETTFSVPGIGGLLVQTATAKDVPAIQAVALLVAAVIVVANVLVDVVYAASDPRVRLGRNP